MTILSSNIFELTGYSISSRYRIKCKTDSMYIAVERIGLSSSGSWLISSYSSGISS